MVAHASDASPDSAAIRREDLEDEMTGSFLKSVHATDLHDACKDALGTGIEISTKAYGDLDGDGREEAAVTAFSCLAGNGGPDLIAVFTLTPNGKVQELPIEKRKWNEPFKGRDPSVGLRGQMGVAIENGQLIEKFPIFTEADLGCCTSAGTREFIYRWKTNKLVLEDIVDLKTLLPPLQPGPSRAIRAVDVRKFLEENTFGFVPGEEMQELKENCADNGRDLLDVENLDYADLDGDGQEEAIYEGFTCMSGSGGMDFFGVVKLTRDGKLIDMPIKPHEGPFKDRDVYEGLRGHMSLAVEDGKLVEVYPVYKDNKECEACSSGGQRKFIFRWDRSQFVLENVVDVPEASAK
ncbi:MAG: hypothetical protein WCA49_09660 [Candidatus Sulfotelmatobacter sp.]